MFIFDIQRLLATQTGVHFFIIDADHNMIFLNELQRQVSVKLCGASLNESFIGVNISEIYRYDQEKADLLRQQNEEVLTCGSPKSYFTCLTIPNTSKIELLTTKFPIKENNNWRVFGISNYLSEISLSVANQFNLSNREIDCLAQLVSGRTAREIAEQLNLSSRTVESYMESLKNKMNCHNKSELIAKANQLGFKKIYTVL